MNSEIEGKDSQKLRRPEFISSPITNEIPRFSPKLNLAVMASGNGSNFEALYKSIVAKQIDAKISVLIVNNNQCMAKTRAEYLGVKCEYIDHRTFKTREEYDERILYTLYQYNVESIIMAGWMRIISPVLINKYPDRIINIHPSLLPSFKGNNAIKQAIDSKVKISGCTVHRVVKDVDSGEIIAQAAVAINKDETVESLKQKIQEREHQLLPIGVALAAMKWRCL
tara:strand:- start:1322 stop:1996 length:675 start_codon:yes stop_codon:yes gene_type:complete